MKHFYSNGKLLLTGEYFVLDGAKSLAVPTSCGQSLLVEKLKDPQLVWKSLTNTNTSWLEVVFELPSLKIISATFDSETDGGNDTLAEKLAEILLQAKKLNPIFLNKNEGFRVKTELTFPKNWGLGTSSTLINNIANWAQINPFELLNKTFGGSGYDIACAQNNNPILYTKTKNNPIIDKVNFNPQFKDQLYFVYLNNKQNSREGIARYKSIQHKLTNEVNFVSQLTNEMLDCKSLNGFEKVIIEHEKVVATSLQLKRAQEIYFSDYFGQTKSLGAWGGDFILATGNNDSINYFRKKGFNTVLKYKDLILNG